MTHLFWTSCNKAYALPLSAVLEVADFETLCRVPRAPPAIHGVTNLHGRVVTVVDLGPLVGAAPRTAGAGDKLIVLARGAGDLALCVSAQVELSELPGSADVTVLDPERLEELMVALVPNP